MKEEQNVNTIPTEDVEILDDNTESANINTNQINPSIKEEETVQHTNPIPTQEESNIVDSNIVSQSLENKEASSMMEQNLPIENQVLDNNTVPNIETLQEASPISDVAIESSEVINSPDLGVSTATEVLDNNSNIDTSTMPLESTEVAPFDNNPMVNSQQTTTENLDVTSTIPSSIPNNSTPVSQKTTEISDIASSSTIEENLKKNKKLLIALLCESVVLILVATAVVIVATKNSKKIIAASITEISTNIEDKFTMNNDLELGNTFTYNGNLILNIQSDLLTNYASSDPEYAGYLTIINNLNRSNNSIVLKQDASNEKFLVGLNSKYNDGATLIHAKGYLQNNTMYYFVDGLLDTYINGGENNYFQYLKDNEQNQENIKYIYDVAITSLKNNLKDEYFTKEKVTTKIGNEDIKLTKISLNITDKVLKELATNILNDLKKDKKANEILSGYNKDFKDAKIRDEQILSDDEYITYSVYVGGLKSDIKKYELEIVQHGDIYLGAENDKYVISYEKGEVGKLTLYVNDEWIGYANITQENDITSISMMDSKDRKISTITIAKNDNNYKINANIDYMGYTLYYEMDTEINNIIKGESYNQNATMNIRVDYDNSNIVNATITLNGRVEKGALIAEDVSTAVKQETVDSDKLLDFLSKIYTTLATPMS